MLFHSDEAKFNKILKTMHRVDLAPNASTYTAMMIVHAENGQLDKIQATIKRCEDNGFQLIDHHYCDIIDALIAHNQTEHIDAMLSYLPRDKHNLQARIRLILKLVNQNKRDMGFRILKTFPDRLRPNELPIDNGTFFLKQIVLMNCPYDEMLGYANELLATERYSEPHLQLLRSCLEFGRQDDAIRLLHYMRSQGATIEQLYFWPLICAQTSNDAIIALLQMMQQQFNCEANIETLSEYVIPNMKDVTNEEICQLLTGTGISAGKAMASLALHAINSNDLKSAAEITSWHRTYLSPQRFRTALKATPWTMEAIDSYFIIIRNIYDNYRIRKGEEAAPMTKQITKYDILGILVFDALKKCEYGKQIECAERLLEKCVAEDIGMRDYHCQRIRSLFKGNLPSHVNHNLIRLTQNGMSSSLRSTSIHRCTLIWRGKQYSDADDFNRILLKKCCKTNNSEQYEMVLGQMEKEQKAPEIDQYLDLIQIYVNLGDANKTMTTYQRAMRRRPDLRINHELTQRIVSLLLLHDQLSAAEQFLAQNQSDINRAGDNIRDWNNLLHNLAMAGKVKETKAILIALDRHRYVHVTNHIAGHVVRAHLVVRDLPSAVDTFEWLSTAYAVSPILVELQSNLIDANDMVMLERVFTLSCNVHNRANALWCLAQSYIECEQLDGAVEAIRKIELIGSMGDVASGRMIALANKWYRMNHTGRLNALFLVSREFESIDSTEIYHYLMLSLCREQSPERALACWNMVQGTHLVPKKETLHRFGMYLKSKNVEVPFDM